MPLMFLTLALFAVAAASFATFLVLYRRLRPSRLVFPKPPWHAALWLLALAVVPTLVRVAFGEGPRSVQELLGAAWMEAAGTALMSGLGVCKVLGWRKEHALLERVRRREG